jgi:hypothetical protein
LEQQARLRNQHYYEEFVAERSTLAGGKEDPAKVPRLEFLNERIEFLSGSPGKVKCPQCGCGRLRVRTEDWRLFADPDSQLLYWPEWHSNDISGNLTITTTRDDADGRKEGSIVIERTAADWNFWNWFVRQPDHQRPVNEMELPAIRDAYDRTWVGQ